MFERWTVLALLVLPSAASAQQPGYNWYNTGPNTKAICKHLGPPKPPAADRPTPAQMKALRGCDAEKLYYGEGAKPDYVKARQCAFAQEQGQQDDTVFSGKTILMQLYANGLGVKRDPDLATACACQIDGAPFEIDGRVADLQSLKAKPGHFDYCNDITSGLAQGFCEARASRDAAVSRDGRLRAVVAKLPLATRALYPQMKRNFDAYVDAHGDGEVDLSGTARGAMVIAEQDSVRDQFLRDLDRLASGRWPQASAGDAQAADAQLNASYRKALSSAASKDNPTTIKPEDIRKAQRSWLAYRDAFLRLAAQVPGTNRDALLTRLTRLRIALLDQLSQN